MTNLLETHKELVAIDGLLDDEDVQSVLEIVEKILRFPDKSSTYAEIDVPRLEAYAVLFALKKHYYMSIAQKTKDNTARKNLYFTLEEKVHDLSNALKYLVKR